MTAKPVPLERLYDYITGDEDARVCKDIPDAACTEQPHNFFAYLLANLLSKIADEIASAKLVLPWMLGLLGAPVYLSGLLVPIRESGVLLPQLAVAAGVRKLARRKWVWVVGGLFSALAMAGMAVTATRLEGAAAGWVIVGMLVIFSLARGLCSVSAKDVLGKTVSKGRRGTLMGWSAGLSGLAVIGIGLALSSDWLQSASLGVFAGLLAAGAGIWLLAGVAFARIREEPGATEGGGNALGVAIGHLRLVKEDRAFRQYLLARALLLSVALAPPYYVLLAQSHTGTASSSLGWMMIAAGIGAAISSPVWGRLGDRSSRWVMVLAAAGAALLGLSVGLLIWLDSAWLKWPLLWAGVILILTVIHSGVRLGRKVYVVDLASADKRAAYVAVSNTLIGLVMLLAGAAGILAEPLGAAGVLLVLSWLAVGAAVYASGLPEISATH